VPKAIGLVENATSKREMGTPFVSIETLHKPIDRFGEGWFMQVIQTFVLIQVFILRIIGQSI
jgi:hypothetical protein